MGAKILALVMGLCTLALLAGGAWVGSSPSRAALPFPDSPSPRFPEMTRAFEELKPIAPRPAQAQAPAPEAADRTLRAALSQTGVEYQYGGNTPGQGFDCSGLTRWAFGSAGLNIPRTSREQYAAGRPVDRQGARPGDLVFFGRGGEVSHVGILMDRDRFVHSSRSGGEVRVNSLREARWDHLYAGVRRVAAGPGLWPLSPLLEYFPGYGRTRGAQVQEYVAPASPNQAGAPGRAADGTEGAGGMAWNERPAPDARMEQESRFGPDARAAGSLRRMALAVGWR